MSRLSLNLSVIVVSLLLGNSSVGANRRLLEQLSPRWPNRGIRRIKKVVSFGVVPTGTVPAVHVVNALWQLVHEKVINPHNTIFVPDSRILRLNLLEYDPNIRITEESALAYSIHMNRVVRFHRNNALNRKGSAGCLPDGRGDQETVFADYLTKFLVMKLGVGIAWLEVPRNKQEHRQQLIAREDLKRLHRVHEFKDPMSEIVGLQEARGQKPDAWEARPFLSTIEKYSKIYREHASKVMLPLHEPVAQKLSGLLTRDVLKRYGLFDLLQDIERVTILRISANEGLETLDSFFETHEIPHQKYVVSGDRSSLAYRFYAEFVPPPIGEFLPPREREIGSATKGHPVELDTLRKWVGPEQRNSSKNFQRHDSVQRLEIERLIALALITHMTNSAWTKMHKPSDNACDEWKVKLDLARYYLLSQLNDLEGLDFDTRSALPKYSNEELPNKLADLIPGRIPIPDEWVGLIPEHFASPSERESWVTLKDSVSRLTLPWLVDRLSAEGARQDLIRAHQLLDQKW